MWYVIVVICLPNVKVICKNCGSLYEVSVNGSLGYDVQKWPAFILQLIPKKKKKKSGNMYNEEVMGAVKYWITFN